MATGRRVKGGEENLVRWRTVGTLIGIIKIEKRQENHTKEGGENGRIDCARDEGANKDHKKYQKKKKGD